LHREREAEEKEAGVCKGIGFGKQTKKKNQRLMSGKATKNLFSESGGGE